MLCFRLLKNVYSPIVRLVIPVSSICMIWVFPIHSTSIKKKLESSIIFLWNGVLILIVKENKEAGAIYFELWVPRKKNKEIFWKAPSKIYGRNFIMEKNRNIFWFVNIFKYHHREMGLWSAVFLVLCTVARVPSTNYLHFIHVCITFLYYLSTCLLYY